MGTNLGHALLRRGRRDRFDPIQKGFLKLLGFDGSEETPDRVVRRNAARQFDEAPQPVDLFLAKLFDIRGAIGTGQSGRDRQKEHVQQGMHLGPLDAWIVDCLEVLAKGNRSNYRRHRRPP
jgi:hypothetical protein